MRKVLFIVSLLVILSATPALAVTDGELDKNGHPMVGLMVALDKDDNPLWRCSGTLVSSKVYVTAGHCTEPPAAKATIWFDDDVESGIPENGYPFEGDVDGTPYVHPKYDPNAFWRYDLGVVVLNKPVRLAKYASLPPEVDYIDKKVYRKWPKLSGQRKLGFTAVGYGLQKAFTNPKLWERKEEANKVRMVAYPKLIQINVPGSTGLRSLILSNNTNTGGTCFGDSGGPNFVKDSLVIGGVTSFGKNGQCAGQGGVFRVDRAQELRWLRSFPR